MTQSDTRLTQLSHWISQLEPSISAQLASIRPASNDASFRRYFRLDCTINHQQTTVIAMDAPPPNEDCAPFVHAAQIFADGGVNTPRILAQNIENGFLLLSDFGSQTMLAALQEDADLADTLYRQAGRDLVTLQLSSRAGVFAEYNHDRLLAELRLFEQWYLPRHKNVEPDEQTRQMLATTYKHLIDNHLSQGRVFVHRDYHSRNLMVIQADASLGVLDFQDALYGPITYDLVSLLRDAYICWPEDQTLDWAIRYWEAAKNADLPVNADFGQFFRDFEWMGLQRHLKVLGIFTRLNYRDGKPAYLDDIPLVLAYVLRTTRRYREFAGLNRLLESLEEQTKQVGYTF